MPLYHQIAEALRNAIAVGELQPGERLPPVRDAAGEWGVNLHTVRRAYGVLEREGLVRVDGARGTAVAGRPAGGAGGGRGDIMAGARAAGARSAGAWPGETKSPDLDSFLAEWTEAAGRRFGLTPARVGELLLSRSPAVRPRVHVLECSRTQAEGHCTELMGAWRVAAEPAVLGELEALPPGVLVGTYFHYNDIRQRWPERLGEVRFVAIAPDAQLPERIPRARADGTRRRLVVCELDGAKALNIAADLRTLFPEAEYVIEPRVLKRPSALPRAQRDGVILVSPRVWGALRASDRRRVVHIRYCIRAQDLEALGTTSGWHRAGGEGT